ncbi:hypothetical protein EDF66_103331 [Sphingobacterium sp. JUb20]|nr:hypothetical protein [Sphingobacterium sp. JUb21]TCR08779.1 hypothetical protein EDF66_103331 [Sphingobacterium sp. JUb20]
MKLKFVILILLINALSSVYSRDFSAFRKDFESALNKSLIR